MEQEIPREDCEQISVVLVVRGSEAQRGTIRRMMRETLLSARRECAGAQGSMMTRNARDVSFFRVDGSGQKNGE